MHMSLKGEIPASPNYRRPDITGAGPCVISRPNADGVLVECETIAAPSVEEFKQRFAKRGPKPGQKVADRSARGNPASDYESEE